MRPGLITVFFAMIFNGIFAQVNLQTGAAEQSFPLINYVDSKSGLTLGVSANYSSGNGLLVNSLASDLGTGWSLDAGGVISRVQVGQPDDQPEFDNGQLTGNESLKRYPAGYLYNNGIGQGCPKGIDLFPVFEDDNKVYKQKNNIAADLQQDKFVFSMNGRSGSFIIGKDWKATTIGDSRIKISIAPPRNMTDQGIRTTIDIFTITTEDGIKYTFDTKILSHITRYKYSQPGKPSDAPKAVNRFYGELLGQDERPYIVSAWYLTQIENTNNGEKILFEYDNITHDIINAKYISHSRDLNNSGRVAGLNKNSDRKRYGRSWFNILSDPENAFLYSSNTAELDKLKAGPTSITYIRSVTKTKRIKRIILPNNGQVLFHYNWRRRTDLPGDNAISRIDYMIGSNLIRGFQFEQGYFYKNTIRAIDASFNSFESKFARLCLLSIQKLGNGIDNVTEPPYKFTYYLGEKSVDNFVPARNFLSQDHWGYHNGSVSGLSFSEDHDFLSDEENQYLKMVLYKNHQPNKGFAKNGLLKDVIYPTGGILKYEYKQNRRRTLSIIDELDDGGVSVSKTILSQDVKYDGADFSNEIITEYSYTLSNGKSSRWGYERPSYTSLNHSVYDEQWMRKKYKYVGIEYPEMAVNSPSSSNNWGKFLLNSALGFAAQTAVSAILTAAGASAAVPILNAVVLAASIAVLIINAIKTYEFHRFYLTNSNDMLSNPIGGLYSRVEVKNNSPSGYNGKTVYEYTSRDDHPLLEKEHKWPYAQKQRAANWVYGLLKQVAVFDKDNKIVSETKNDYRFYLEKIADVKNINCACVSRHQLSIASDKWANLSGFTPNNIVYYSYTGRSDLYASYQKEYVNGNLYYTNTTRIAIDPLTLLPKGETVKKDENTYLVKRTFYPNDYDLPGAIALLKTNNAIHTPIATETILMKVTWVGGPIPAPFMTPYLIDANATEYKIYTFNGKQVVKPWKTYALKTKVPILGGIGHTRNKLLSNPDHYKETSEMFYDADGNLIQTKSDDQVSCFINDHSDRYVVASVANASHNDIAYNSFESNGNGNWNFNASNITTGGVTGSSSYQLSSAATITNKNLLNTNNTYSVTYWYKPTASVSATVNGSTGELLYQSPDGWKLFKHTVSGATNISISGDGKIDEVRLYPSNALMSTVSYQEGIGKVSECDANNRLLFYEYDGLGRLMLIRDQNKNVIKTYEYNYKK